MQRFTTTIRRSRNGCESCKKLKIKCNEQKPTCKHCLSTQRYCVYKQPPVAQHIEFGNMPLSKMTHILGLSEYQQRVLKNYTQSGSSLLSRSDEYAIKVWTVNIPNKLSNPLVREALFCIGSLCLWSGYDLETIDKVYYRDDGVTRYLVQETEKRFSDLLHKLNLLDYNKTFENDGSIMIALMCVNCYLFYHPSPPIPLVDFSGTESANDSLGFCLKARESLYNKAKYLKDSGIEELPALLQDIDSAAKIRIPIIDYLKEYIREHSDQRDAEALAMFETIIRKFENIVQDFVTTEKLTRFYSCLPPILINDVRFITNIRKKEYIPMKIFFFASAMCQILQLYVHSVSSVWLQYMDKYMEICGDKDPYDAWLYRCVVQEKFKLSPGNIHMICQLGARF